MVPASHRLPRPGEGELTKPHQESPHRHGGLFNSVHSQVLLLDRGPVFWWGVGAGPLPGRCTRLLLSAWAAERAKVARGAKVAGGRGAAGLAAWRCRFDRPLLGRGRFPGSLGGRGTLLGFLAPASGAGWLLALGSVLFETSLLCSAYVASLPRQPFRPSPSSPRQSGAHPATSCPALGFGPRIMSSAVSKAAKICLPPHPEAGLGGGRSFASGLQLLQSHSSWPLPGCQSVDLFPEWDAGRGGRSFRLT